MKTTAVIFALAAVGGLTLAFLRLSGTENPPTSMVIAHGVIAATALGSLILIAVEYGLSPLGKAALGTFVVAAIGGVYLFVTYQLTESPLPIPLMSLHGGLALTGFGLLLAGLYARHAQRAR